MPSRKQAKGNGETLLERGLCISLANGACRRDPTYRYLHSSEEWRKLDAVEKTNVADAIQTVRGVNGRQRQ